MIPHQPPMRFEVEHGVVLPLQHPLARDGGFLALDLIELAAQCAGRALTGEHRSGMLVEVESAKVLSRWVPAGTWVEPQVTPVRQMAGLFRFFVVLPEILEVNLTLRVM